MKRRLTRMIIGLMMLSLISCHQNQNYTYLYGTVDYHSSVDSDIILHDSYYYADDWFFESPKKQNDALALVSMQLTVSVAESRKDDPAYTFLKQLGFHEIHLIKQKKCCTYLQAKKTITKGHQSAELVAIIIQSYPFDADGRQEAWKQNFQVNGDLIADEHEGFALAVDDAMADIQALAEEKTKIWIMGYSRGGALAGMIASRLSQESTYAYTFEAPAMTSAQVKGFQNIHNYSDSSDLVIHLPPWNLSRYGMTHAYGDDDVQEVNDELKKLGSSLTYKGGDHQARIQDILKIITGQIQTRSDYSKAILLPNGETYTYQEAFANIASAYLSGKGLNQDRLLNDPAHFIPVIKSLAKGMKDHDDAALYKGAKSLHAYLASHLKSDAVGVNDLYLYFKAAGGLYINPDPDLTGLDFQSKKDQESILYAYLAPAMTFIGESETLIEAHRFEIIIARLKLMAPAPQGAS